MRAQNLIFCAGMLELHSGAWDGPDTVTNEPELERG